MVQVKIVKPSKGKAIVIEEEKTLTPKEGLPIYFSIEESLLLPKEMRKSLVAILASPDDHKVQESKDKGIKLQPHEYATCCAAHDAINFTDLLMGSKPDNRHLFISRYVKEHKVNNMVADSGSAISIMPKSTMITIGIIVDELSQRHFLVQGFNHGGQRAMGMIQVQITISTQTKHAIPYN
ncbi:hypothetical protein ACFX1S_019300 [Malus domestica]